jgi:hypothetical protein
MRQSANLAIDLCPDMAPVAAACPAPKPSIPWSATRSMIHREPNHALNRLDHSNPTANSPHLSYFPAPFPDARKGC